MTVRREAQGWGPASLLGARRHNARSVTFRRVEYDIERTAQAILASDLPHVFADQLREARGYANPIVAVP